MWDVNAQASNTHWVKTAGKPLGLYVFRYSRCQSVIFWNSWDKFHRCLRELVVDNYFIHQWCSAVTTFPWIIYGQKKHCHISSIREYSEVKFRWNSEQLWHILTIGNDKPTLVVYTDANEGCSWSHKGCSWNSHESALPVRSQNMCLPCNGFYR